MRTQRIVKVPKAEMLSSSVVPQTSFEPWCPFSIGPYQGGQTLPIHGGVLKYNLFYLIYLEPQYKVHFDITYSFHFPNGVSNIKVPL